MVIISNYLLEAVGGKIYVRAKESSVCPVCTAGLKVIGSKWRKAIGLDGTQQTYVIRRLRCTACNKIHHELPDLLVPYKRHYADTIEQAVDEEEDAKTGLKSSTISRLRQWWRGVKRYFEPVSLALKFKYGLCLPAPKIPRECCVYGGFLCSQLCNHSLIFAKHPYKIV